MRVVIRFQALGLLIAVVLGVWWLRSARATDAVAIRSNVEVSGATPEQLAMARWAVGRFEMAGLQPPVVRIEFQVGPSGCGGHLGLAREGKVEVCTTLVNAMARRALLHEMSHIWLDQNVDAATRARFLVLRDLESWNASIDPWGARGYEQGAEIVSWEIGERIITPQIPNSAPREVALAYELLTGSPHPAAPTRSAEIRSSSAWMRSSSSRAISPARRRLGREIGERGSTTRPRSRTPTATWSAGWDHG